MIIMYSWIFDKKYYNGKGKRFKLKKFEYFIKYLKRNNNNNKYYMQYYIEMTISLSALCIDHENWPKQYCNLI